MRTVSINVECPSCQSRFHLQSEMIGRKMRCPTCYEVFEVQEMAAPATSLPPPEAEEAPAPEPGRDGTRADAPEPRYQTGSVGDLIPILEAEVEIASSPQDEPAHLDVIPLEMEEAVPDEPESHAGVGELVPLESAEIVPQEPEIIVVEEEESPSEPAPGAPREVVWSEDVAPPEPPAGAREVVWSEEAAPPSPPLPALEPAVLAEADEEEPSPAKKPAREVAVHEEAVHHEEPAHEETEYEIRHRERKRRRAKMVLTVLSLCILGALGVGGYYGKRYLDQAPDRLFKQAREEYEKQNYAGAAKLFGEFTTRYPDNPQRPEARFFAELSPVRGTVYSVLDRGNPGPGREQVLNFLKSAEDDPELAPFLKPDAYAVDVWQTVQKSAEDVLGRAGDVFAEYRGDSATTPKLDETEALLDQGMSLVPLLERFRPKETEPESVIAGFRELRGKVFQARERRRVLDEARELLKKDPSEENIQAVQETFRQYGLENDPEVTDIIKSVQKILEQQVKYEPYKEPVPPVPARDDMPTGLLFAPRLDGGRSAPAGAGGQGAVYFAVARGVLYALDEGDGHVLWATRVGIDCDTLPLRVPASDRNPELVLVTVNDGGRSSLTARVARNGEPFWNQPLESPCLGQPVLVGQRVYVATRDKPPVAGRRPKREDVGVILEIEIGTGYRLGRITLGRPLGAGGVRRPGTGLLYFPAEARGVYVFDVERRDPAGTRQDPVCLGIIPTGHLPGTLRAAPVLANAEPDYPGPKYLILAQADGLNEMNLRAFPLPPPDAKEFPPEKPVEIKLDGWTWFPPRYDGEKLAVVTDRGEFGLFGINQAGNQDAPLFPLPPGRPKANGGGMPSRGLVVHAEERGFWVLANGSLHHLRLGFTAEEGQKLVPRGQPVPVGEPLHAAQVGPRGEVFVVVTQVPNSSSCRATAVDLRAGAVRWQRQLGLIVQGDPVRLGEAVVLQDQSGGLYRIDPFKERAFNSEWLIDDRWQLAPPLAEVVGSPLLLPAPDGKSVYAVAVAGAEGNLRLVVRQYVPGQPIESRRVGLPAPLAGRPVLVGSMLVVPLANGSLYRLVLPDAKMLEEGPSWRGERRPPTSVCYLAPLNEDEFITTDGDRALLRYRWKPDGNLFEVRARTPQDVPQPVPARIVAPPLAVPGADGTLFLCVADVKGVVSLWDADRLNRPVRMWRGGTGPIPEGPITMGPFLERDPRVKARIGYVVDGAHLVWLSPEGDEPLWVARRKARTPGDGLAGRPQVAGDRIYLTDRLGWFRALDAESGEAWGEAYQLPGSSAPASAAVPLTGKRLLAPLTDGTLLLLPKDVLRPLPPILFVPARVIGVPVLPLPWPKGLRPVPMEE